VAVVVLGGGDLNSSSSVQVPTSGHCALSVQVLWSCLLLLAPVELMPTTNHSSQFICGDAQRNEV